MSCNPNPPGPKSASACSSASRGVSGVVTWYRIGSPLRAHTLGAHEVGTWPASLETTERAWRTRRPHTAPRFHSPNGYSKTRANCTTLHGWRYTTGGGEVGARGQRALRHRTAHGEGVRWWVCA